MVLENQYQETLSVLLKVACIYVCMYNMCNNQDMIFEANVVIVVGFITQEANKCGTV